MNPNEKLLFLYASECSDNAGFIPHDDKLAAFYTGIGVKRIPTMWGALGDKIIIENGWVWLRDFPLLQRNWPLNPGNGAHKQIIRLLAERRELFKDSPVFTTFLTPCEGLLWPLGIGNNNGKGLCNGLGNGFSRGQGNGYGKGQGQEIENINQELQECATKPSDSNNNREEMEEERPF